MRLSVGGSSIVVIFVILTLTTFATLSLVSARADQSLGRKSVEATEAYYAADARAEEILAEIDMLLQEHSVHGTPEFAVRAALVLASGSPVVFEVLDDMIGPGDTSLTIRYSVQINDIQHLDVELELRADFSSRYEVKQWRLITDPGEEEEDPIQLVDM